MNAEVHWWRGWGEEVVHAFEDPDLDAKSIRAVCGHEIQTDRIITRPVSKVWHVECMRLVARGTPCFPTALPLHALRTSAPARRPGAAMSRDRTPPPAPPCDPGRPAGDDLRSGPSPAGHPADGGPPGGPDTERAAAGWWEESSS